MEERPRKSLGNLRRNRRGPRRDEPRRKHICGRELRRNPFHASIVGDRGTSDKRFDFMGSCGERRTNAGAGEGPKVTPSTDPRGFPMTRPPGDRETPTRTRAEEGGGTRILWWNRRERARRHIRQSPLGTSLRRRRTGQSWAVS